MRVRALTVAWLGGVLLAGLPGCLVAQETPPVPDSLPVGDSLDSGEPETGAGETGIDPVVLPVLEAKVRWRAEETGGTRSVSEVRFEETPITWRDVGEWLSTGSGVSVRGSAVSGGEAISVRGSRPEGVLVLLDGHPLNDPATGRADLSAVPVGSLRSATLVKGASSARYGSGALSGVLLLESWQAGKSGSTGAIGISSYGGFAGEVHTQLGGSAGTASLSLMWDEARNDFEYENRVLPGSPVETRYNTDASRLSVSTAASTGRWRLGLRYDGSERGSPGPIGNRLFDEARWADRRAIGTVGWQGAGGGIAGRVGWSESAWDPGTGGAGTGRRSLVLGLGGDARSGGGLDLELAGRLSVESLRGDDLPGGARRVLAGVSLARTVRTGGLDVRPALSLDGSGGRWAFSPEVGVHAPIGASIAVRARAGQAFRLPTMADLYLSPALQVRPNPDLEPERVRIDAELGLTGNWRLGRYELAAELAGWYRQTENPIVWLASAAARWSPRNLDHLSSAGFESGLSLSTDASSTSGWKIAATGTLDRSRLGFDANRNAMPYRPASVAALGLHGWSAPLSGRVLLRWTGPRTTTVAGTRSLPGFTTLDLAAAWRLPLGPVPLQLEGRVENLLDRRYELVELYPEPGRRFSFTLRYR